MSNIHSKVIASVIFSIILVTSAVLVVDNTHKMSYETKARHSQTIFNNLQKHTGLGVMFPGVVILDTDEINAYASLEGIYITKGMLNFLKSDDEIAFVLGHELGHFVMGHLISGHLIDPRLDESNADKYGAYLAIRSGYDICAGKAPWIRLKEEYGNVILTSSHPSFDDRIDGLDFPQCH